GIADASHSDVLTVRHDADRIGRVGAVDLQRVRAAEAVDDQLIVIRLGAGDGHRGGQTAHSGCGGAAGNAYFVVAGGGIDHHRVGRTIAGAGAGLCRQVDGNLLHIGPGQIVDDDVVGPTARVELDTFDAVEVHRDVGDVADEPHTR